jgi:hypothetical protein
MNRIIFSPFFLGGGRLLDYRNAFARLQKALAGPYLLSHPILRIRCLWHTARGLIEKKEKMYQLN